MNLKTLREKTIITVNNKNRNLYQSDIHSYLVDNSIDISLPQYCDIENKKLMPTREMLKLICLKLVCQPLDIYSRKELDLIHCLGEEKKEINTVYNVHFALPKEVGKNMSEMLKVCGYDSLKEWGKECIDRLEMEYKVKLLEVSNDKR